MGLFDIFGSQQASTRIRVEPAIEVPAIRAASPENPSTSLANPDDWLFGALGGGNQTFGPRITERTAMAVSAVYRAVSLESGLVAGLPLKVYEDTGNGRRVAKAHRLYRLLHDQPYPGRPLTSFAWREHMVTGLLLWGNSYSIIRYDAAGRIVGFEPVMPWNVEVYRRNYRNLYRCILEGGEVEWVDFEDMLHIAGPGFDGISGLSRIQSFARSSIALARTIEDQQGLVHENAARPSGMMEIPPGIKPEGLARLKTQFSAQHVGRDAAGRVMFVDKDTKYTPFQINPADLQTIEARRYQVSDIARFFGTPPHMLGEAANTSAWGTGIEQLTIGFLKFTLEADLKRIEDELLLKLFAGTSAYAEFDREALLAMDAKTAAEVMQTQIHSGVRTINEARSKLNLSDVDGGNETLVNSTMVPLKRALNSQPATPGVPPNA